MTDVIKTGVLILAHGSRVAETEETLNSVVEMVKSMIPGTQIRVAYMEFGKVNIEAGLDMFAAEGIKDIRVVPYFLFRGIHIKEDIPHEIGEYRKKHPDISIRLGETLGADIRLAQILKDRIEEALA